MSNCKHYPAKHILIFDSGVGGLSIAEKIQQQLPESSITYCSDNAAFPYGTKNEQVLVSRTERVLQALQKKEPCDIIIIACNSASTLALPHIRSQFKQPVIGVVPAIKPAAKLSKNRQIGVLATPGTVSRAYTHKLVEDFAKHCDVHMLGSSELVVMAEKKLRGTPLDPELLTPILKPLKTKNIDTLVLACTHFPLLKQEIQDWFGPSVTLVDSANAIARRVQYLLQKGIDTNSNTNSNTNTKSSVTAPANQQTPVHRCYFTANTKDIWQLEPALKHYNFNDVRILEV